MGIHSFVMAMIMRKKIARANYIYVSRVEQLVMRVAARCASAALAEEKVGTGAERGAGTDGWSCVCPRGARQIGVLGESSVSCWRFEV